MVPKETLRLTVNGDPFEVAAAPNQTLLEVLRETVGLTGTKRGCDDASCGACTVLVDGRPVLACIRLALTCDGAEITTVEGAARTPLGARIEKALAEEGGLQCGFCTPGIVLAAQAIFREDPHPGEEALRAGLSGNLCRCTGYLGILEALKKVSRAPAAPRAAGGKPAADSGSAASVVGNPRPLLDAGDRASGRAAFVEDLRFPGMLHGRFLRSPHPHARIIAVDVSRALAIPGVHAVITGKDIPHRYGVMPVGHDETALAVDKARYAGQEVAAVAAVSEEIAEEALAAIGVDYEVLPSYLTAQEALDARSHWIHEDRPRNIEKEYHHAFGSPEAGFAGAEVIVEDDFFHPRVTHAAIEPHGTVAVPEAGGRITLWTSTQAPRHIQRGVSMALGIPESAVRVIPCAVGGGFGGKSETFPQDVAGALLARLTGRAVRFRLSREEVFFLHRGRPESHIRMRLGLRRDGKIAAVECETIQDGGAFCGYGVASILYSGALLGAIYDVEHLRFDGYRVLTTKPACGPMRGHGTIGARHAFEALLDRAAAALGLDPLEVRRRNLLRPNVRTVNDLRVTSYGYPRCLELVAEASGWREKRGKLPPGRGIGLAGSHYVSGASNAILRGGFPHSTVLLQAERDGSVTLFSGASELGQGSTTAQAVIAAQVLGLSPGDIRVVAGDTALTPVDLGSYSSRVTFMTGNAVLEASRKLASRILQGAAAHLGVGEEELELRDRGVRRRGDGKPCLSFLEALRLAVKEDGALAMKGSYWPPPAAQGGSYPGAGVGPGVSFSYAAQAVEVEVNGETGAVKVVKVWAAHDCGRALNPLAVKGQVEGSVWMGLGQALGEAQSFSPQGRPFNGGLLEYKVPTSVESPPVEVFIVESGDPEGPFGAKEAGEGSLAAVLPAFTNALYDATGIWFSDLPVTPAKVLAALEEKRTGKASRERRVKHPVVPRTGAESRSC